MNRDWVVGSNRPRPTAAKREGESPLEYLYRLFSEGKLTYMEGEVYKHYDFRGKGKWLEIPISIGKEDPNGYIGWTYRFNGRDRKITIHRLVYLAFNGPEQMKNANMQVNHIDGNKKNNRIENLELVTSKENTFHAVRTGLRNPENTNTAKLTWEDVRKIREMYTKEDVTQQELSKIFGVKQPAISSIVLKRTWRDYGDEGII